MNQHVKLKHKEYYRAQLAANNVQNHHQALVVPSFGAPLDNMRNANSSSYLSSSQNSVDNLAKKRSHGGSDNDEENPELTHEHVEHA